MNEISNDGAILDRLVAALRREGKNLEKCAPRSRPPRQPRSLGACEKIRALYDSVPKDLWRKALRRLRR